MKTFRKIGRFITALCLMFGFAACSDSDDAIKDTDIVVKSPDAFTGVKVGMFNYATTDVRYKIVFHDDVYADVYIDGLSFIRPNTGGDTSPRSYVIKDVIYRHTNAAGISTFEISAASLKAKDGTEFSDFSLIYQNGHAVDDEIYQRLAIRFRCGVYEIIMVPKENICIGTTVVAAWIGDEPYFRSTEKTVYKFLMHPDKGMADMSVLNPEFVVNAGNIKEMLLTDIDVEYTANGFKFEKRNIVPLIEGEPERSQIISYMRGNMDLLGTNKSMGFEYRGQAIQTVLLCGLYK